MKWIKASERLPKDVLNWATKTIGTNGFVVYGSLTIAEIKILSSPQHGFEIEWLDESDQPNSVQEGEKEAVEGWISVKDRLPEVANVLVAYKFGVGESKFIYGKFWKELSEVPEVTHWQPLPAPPQQ